MAAIYDLYVNQGSDFHQDIDITGDYSGYVIRGKLIDSIGSKTENIVSWADASIGRFEINIPNSVTALFTNGVGHYDIEVEKNNLVSRVIYGRIYIDKEV